MQLRMKVTSCIFLGLFAAGLLTQLAFARQKTARIGKQKFTAAAPAAVAAERAPQPEAGKVILVLETRDHLVTVRSSGGEQLQYSVATPQGIALAERLSVNELKNRFPELHEVVTGTAWAGLDRRAK